jgi:ABC-type nitrate/sulfonate/bicarbonate transport system substrate-binding protein
LTTHLNVALTRYPHTAPLVDGTVTPSSVALDFVPLTSIFPAFRKMARDLEYDVSEFGISTAIQAKALGVGFTPLPVFVTRRFDYDELFYDVRSGIASPAELAGKRVALRSYTVTDAVWARGVLSDHFGFDGDSVEFVVTSDEHLAQAELPSNCVLEPGADLSELLVSGSVAAILGHYGGDDSNIHRLIPDPRTLEQQWIANTGFIPVHHTVVVRDDLLRSNPDLGAELFDAFVRAKEPMLERLADGADLIAEDESPTGPLHDYGVLATSELIRPDPMPYGLDANHEVLEPFVRYCYDQHLIDRPMELEEIFAPV